MPDVLDNVILSAAPDSTTFSVALKWANGDATVSKLGHLLSRGVMKRLADPGFFEKVRVGEYGRSLDWPGGLDFCADALWFEAHPADDPFRLRAEAAERGLRQTA